MTRQWFSAVICSLLSLSAWSATRCEVWEDSQRISHVRVGDEQGFTYCLGYLHGRDRAWMMDHLRRTAMGTNSEVHGFDQLKGDMMMRLLGLPSWAEKLWEGLGEAEKQMLKNYSAGVNHGLRLARQHPTQEFLHGHPWPENWKPQHTLMLLLLQSFDQTRKTFYVEYEESRARDLWKDKVVELYDNDGVPWDTTILKKGEYAAGAPTTKTTRTLPINSELWAQFPAPFGQETGSNNWVVAPSHSRSGKAMLANDPHLDLKTPMFWYWSHLEGPTTDVIGASLPGVPVIVSGTNRHVSWGLTNSYINTADAVFIEKSEEEELESFRPVVWVKFWFFKIPIFFKSFQRTKDGFPVLPLETNDKRALVLKWSGFHLKGEDLSSLRLIMQVKSAQEMEDALARVGIPSWNFVFADTQGKIGHRVVGKSYRTPHKHASGLQAGTLAEVCSSQDFLTPSEMPHVLQPKRGYIATANNRHWPSDAAFYGGRAYSPGFRAMRIEEVLSTGKQDVDTFRKLQCDIVAVDAQYFVPLLVKALEGSELSDHQKNWLVELKAWNQIADLDCRVCPIYRRTLDVTMEKLQVWETGFWRLGMENNPKWLEATREAFKEATRDLEGKVWKDVHLNSFPHLSNRKDWVYAPEIPTRGDKQSVDPGTARWNLDRKIFEHTSGASQRLIVVMNQIPEVWLGLPGLNARYDQHEGRRPWQDWSSCQQARVEWPMVWEGKTLEKVEIEL